MCAWKGGGRQKALCMVRSRTRGNRVQMAEVSSSQIMETLSIEDRDQ